MVSKQPSSDRPGSLGGEGGGGGSLAGGQTLLLATAGTLGAGCPGYCLCPTEHAQRVRETQRENGPLSWRGHEEAQSPRACAYTHTHTCSHTHSGKLK